MVSSFDVIIWAGQVPYASPHLSISLFESKLHFLIALNSCQHESGEIRKVKRNKEWDSYLNPIPLTSYIVHLLLYLSQIVFAVAQNFRTLM